MNDPVSHKCELAGRDYPSKTCRTVNKRPGKLRRLAYKSWRSLRDVFFESQSTRCVLAKASRRDAGDPLEMKAKVALIRETTAERDFCEPECVICLQQVLSSFYPAENYKLVWRYPGCCFKLLREMMRAEANHLRHFLKRRTAFEIFHNVALRHSTLPKQGCLGSLT